MRAAIIASSIFLSINSAQASELIRWDNVSASYQYAKTDLGGDPFKGLGASITKLVGKSFILTGAYSNISRDENSYSSDTNVELISKSVGFGYRFKIAREADLFGIVSYHEAELSSSYDKQSVSGAGLEIGVRSFLTRNIELIGLLNYVDFHNVEGEVGFGISSMYHFSDEYSVGVNYSKSDDVDTLSLSAIYFF